MSATKQSSSRTDPPLPTFGAAGRLQRKPRVENFNRATHTLVKTADQGIPGWIGNQSGVTYSNDDSSGSQRIATPSPSLNLDPEDSASQHPRDRPTFQGDVNDFVRRLAADSGDPVEAIIKNLDALAEHYAPEQGPPLKWTQEIKAKLRGHSQEEIKEYFRRAETGITEGVHEQFGYLSAEQTSDLNSTHELLKSIEQSCLDEARGRSDPRRNQTSNSHSRAAHTAIPPVVRKPQDIPPMPTIGSSPVLSEVSIRDSIQSALDDSDHGHTHLPAQYGDVRIPVSTHTPQSARSIVPDQPWSQTPPQVPPHSNAPGPATASPQVTGAAASSLTESSSSDSSYHPGFAHRLRHRHPNEAQRPSSPNVAASRPSQSEHADDNRPDDHGSHAPDPDSWEHISGNSSVSEPQEAGPPTNLPRLRRMPKGNLMAGPFHTDPLQSERLDLPAVAGPLNDDTTSMHSYAGAESALGGFETDAHATSEASPATSTAVHERFGSSPPASQSGRTGRSPERSQTGSLQRPFDPALPAQLPGSRRPTPTRQQQSESRSERAASPHSQKRFVSSVESARVPEVNPTYVDANVSEFTSDESSTSSVEYGRPGRQTSGAQSASASLLGRGGRFPDNRTDTGSQHNGSHSQAHSGTSQPHETANSPEFRLDPAKPSLPQLQELYAERPSDSPPRPIQKQHQPPGRMSTDHNYVTDVDDGSAYSGYENADSPAQDQHSIPSREPRNPLPTSPTLHRRTPRTGGDFTDWQQARVERLQQAQQRYRESLMANNLSSGQQTGAGSSQQAPILQQSSQGSQAPLPEMKQLPRPISTRASQQYEQGDLGPQSSQQEALPLPLPPLGSSRRDSPSRTPPAPVLAQSAQGSLPNLGQATLTQETSNEVSPPGSPARSPLPPVIPHPLPPVPPPQRRQSGPLRGPGRTLRPVTAASQSAGTSANGQQTQNNSAAGVRPRPLRRESADSSHESVRSELSPAAPPRMPSLEMRRGHPAWTEYQRHSVRDRTSYLLAGSREHCKCTFRAAHNFWWIAVISFTAALIIKGMLVTGNARDVFDNVAASLPKSTRASNILDLIMLAVLSVELAGTVCKMIYRWPWRNQARVTCWNAGRLPLVQRTRRRRGVFGLLWVRVL